MPPKFKNVTFNFLPVKANLPLDKIDTKRRVIGLYKAWYRQMPVILYDYRLPITPEEGRSKLREIFMRNSRLSDLKQISTLVLKGQMELNETVNKQKEDCHVMKYFKEDQKKQLGFLAKFLEGR